jgi:hypothetical protein
MVSGLFCLLPFVVGAFVTILAAVRVASESGA